MKGNTLSDQSPPRILVTLDVVLGDQGIPARKRMQTWKSWAAKAPLDRLVRGHLSRISATLEVVTFGIDLAAAEHLYERLEAEAWPFRYMSSWTSRHDLMETIPFRPEVLAIVDIPEYLLAWGHRGRILQELGAMQ